jgi:protoheme ferro-lyase
MRKLLRKFAAAEQASRSAIVTPCFRADCLEMPEENGVENASYFHDAGGKRFAQIGQSHRRAR